MLFSHILHTPELPIQFLLLQTFRAGFRWFFLYQKFFGLRSGATEILTMISVNQCQFSARLISANWTNVYALFLQIYHQQWMFGIYSQFGLSSNYLCNKNWTIPYFIIWISNRAKFAVRGPISLDKDHLYVIDLSLLKSTTQSRSILVERKYNTLLVFMQYPRNDLSEGNIHNCLTLVLKNLKLVYTYFTITVRFLLFLFYHFDSNFSFISWISLTLVIPKLSD